MKLSYKIGYGVFGEKEKRKRFSKIICRISCWNHNYRSPYEIQKKIIKNAENCKYRNGHIQIIRDIQ